MSSACYVSLQSPTLLIAAPLKMVGEMVGVPVHTIPEDKAAFRKWLVSLLSSVYCVCMYD